MKALLLAALALGCSGYEHGVQTDAVGYACGWLPTPPVWVIEDKVPGKCWLIQPPPTTAVTWLGDRPCGWGESEWITVPPGAILQLWLRIGAEPVDTIHLDPVECDQCAKHK